ncbi:MAG: ATP-binding cassette domain-containing protein [Ignavibacteriaceae bacterium]|nr:ATP-binding cassette domain-containing protein [Ignavibacteriaceae bacterium]
MELVLEVNNLSKAFGSNVILDDLSLKINEGENITVFGQSGTGKSVLLKCIVGLLEPDEGEIKFYGESILNKSMDEINKVRKDIGFLFQSAALYDSMTVRENLEFPLRRNHNFSDEEVDEKVITALEQVGLAKAIDKMPSELSGGMKKRIGLARTIITRPKLILYDEPTTGLDPITTKEISLLITKLQHELKTTSIVVTHDILCAKIVSDRAVVLKEGKLRYEGSLENLFNNDDKFLRNFFSDEIFDENRE